MKKLFLVIWCVAVLTLAFGSVLAAPNGANFTYERNQTAPADTPEHRDAIAGNLTEIVVSGYATTQTWQGYYGNVTGAIQLADGNRNIMYNWSQVTAEGEVYAANSSTVSWSTIGCFNYTSLTELNITSLESQYNIGYTDVDGVDETFNRNDHAEFATGTVAFTSGQCNNTRVFNNAGTGTFHEALLYDASNNIPVFASILNNDATGFDSNSHDFEMLVLEDGHNGNSAMTKYYFYVELSG